MKTRIDIRIDKGLKDFIQAYAKAHRTTVSRLLIEYIKQLKENHNRERNKN